MAPAGVFCIGGVLVLRDWLQQLRGLLWTMPLVYTSCLASWAIGDAAGWTSPEKIVIASVVAFTISETVDAVVFTPLRKRRLTRGVGLSATVGNALDSYIFLALAFGSQAFFLGQFIGKSEMIALGAVLTFARRRLARCRPGSGERRRLSRRAAGDRAEARESICAPKLRNTFGNRAYCETGRSPLASSQESTNARRTR